MEKQRHSIKFYIIFVIFVIPLSIILFRLLGGSEIINAVISGVVSVVIAVFIALAIDKYYKGKKS